MDGTLCPQIVGGHFLCPPLLEGIGQMGNASIKTSNRWDTRTLVTMALLAAIGAALSFVEVPFIAVSFLKYDASNVPALVGGFVFGAAPGFIIGLITCLVHAVFTGDWWGGLMNVAAMAAAVLPAAWLYNRRRTIKGGILGLVIGIVLATAVMIVMNILIDPILYGYSMEAVLALIVPVLLPFNLMKTAINAVLTLLIYKPISLAVKPKRKGAALEEDAAVALSDSDEAGNRDDDIAAAFANDEKLASSAIDAASSGDKSAAASGKSDNEV